MIGPLAALQFVYRKMNAPVMWQGVRKGIASLKEGEEIREEDDDDQSGDQFAISRDTQSICNLIQGGQMSWSMGSVKSSMRFSWL